jgi:hypothetical protein
MCRNELHFYSLCGDIIFNDCLRQEECRWTPVTTIEINTLCQRCTQNPDLQSRSLEEIERRCKRVQQEIAFEQERRVEIDEFRRLLQNEKEISANVIRYVIPMINPPNPSHPTRANALRLIYTYIIFVEYSIDFIDSTNVENELPEIPRQIYIAKLLKDQMKAIIDQNEFYAQQEHDKRQVASILAILTPVAINSLASNEADCTICSEVLGQVDSSGAIELACKTPCSHIFGNRCITVWLKGNDTCPTCRRQLVDRKEEKKTNIGTGVTICKSKVLWF